MKKGQTKRDFNKFTKRNTHKRRDKDRSVKALAKALEEVNSSYGNVKLKAALDLGRRGRTGYSAHRDEIVAEGVFSGSKSGFGFAKVEGEARDIFIPEDKTLGAIDGDLVEVVYHKYLSRGEERTEGRVRKIIAYGRKTVIGEVIRTTVSRRERYLANCYQLLPDDKRLTIRPYILDVGSAREGDKVEAMIDRSLGERPFCRVVRTFGGAETREANYEAILATSGIETEFSPEAISLAEELAARPVTKEGRETFDNDVIFTIDSESAKDLDDAVSLRRLPGGGYRLGVHIADVSYYVTEKTALDRTAMARGCSVYFTNKVVPMLPEALSNGACSLNSGEEKYTMSAIIDLDKDGNIKSARVAPGLIVSSVRGVYSEINKILSGEADAALKKKYARVIPSLDRMSELYEILARNAASRGYVDFDMPEASIILSESGSPVDIVKRERGLSERIIEQFMICANVAVARLLSDAGVPCVYRVHSSPPEEKLESLVAFLSALGIDTAPLTERAPEPRDIGKILDIAEERGLFAPVSSFMLRSMAKAEYSEKNIGHFGLGLSHYAHFTSPIRRLSDLATHRIIRRVLFEGKRAEAYKSYATRASRAATDGELRALDAERRIENLYKVLYMSRFEGEKFDGIISSVSSFGIFVMLDNTCEGLVPISDMPGVFFYDEVRAEMRSRDLTLKLGDKVRVVLEEASISDGKLRFSLVDAVGYSV